MRYDFVISENNELTAVEEAEVEERRRRFAAMVEELEEEEALRQDSYFCNCRCFDDKRKDTITVLEDYIPFEHHYYRDNDGYAVFTD